MKVNRRAMLFAIAPKKESQIQTTSDRHRMKSIESTFKRTSVFIKMNSAAQQSEVIEKSAHDRGYLVIPLSEHCLDRYLTLQQ
jgi:hypothetical protein